MVEFNRLALAVFLASASTVNSFGNYGTRATRAGQTTLNAVPPMIIGPMIKKMKAKQDEKRRPMIEEGEDAFEAPGLRVGRNAWKWPPVWPYDDRSFMPAEDIATPKPDVTGFMSGNSDMVVLEEKEPLDPLKYWGEDKVDELTELDADSAEQLTSFYEFYLKDGMSVLELGAAEESYLPEGLKLSRHVGVGANKALMEKNPALTESYVVDLNDVEEGKGVSSDELKKLSTDPFDVIIMANTIDFLTKPREVYKSSWYLLKSGGTMVVSFTNKEAYKAKFSRAQTKIWRDYNDDQHMWICGSLFHFSAGEGFENLRGFDISPESAKDNLDSGPLSFLQGGKNNNMYAVIAQKGFQDDEIDEDDPEKSIKSRMWMYPVLEDRDKLLLAPRLRRVFEGAASYSEKQDLTNNMEQLPVVYESLIKMDQFSFTFSMQAQLATDLVRNKYFKGNEEQILALKQGLGLRTPSEEFWQPIGELTSAMVVEDKINLLAYIVPCFGSGNPAHEDALTAFVTGLKPTFSLIRRKCPDLSESDVQLLGTELLAIEVLSLERSTREEFAAWLEEMTEAEMKQFLANRKKLNEESTAGVAGAKKRRAELMALYEAQQKLMKEQMEAAREARSVTFDPKTGRFQEVAKKK